MTVSQFLKTAAKAVYCFYCPLSLANGPNQERYICHVTVTVDLLTSQIMLVGL